MKAKYQAIEISKLINQVRDYLTKPSTIAFFKENESLAESLVSSTSGIKSRNMVLYGLKPVVETTTDFLPTNEQLLESRAAAWLSPGDIVAGWIDYLADQPRVIVEATLTGYTWRWFDEEPSTARGPGLGQMGTDKWFQSHGWVKLTGSTIEEIEAEQAAEIEQLNGLLSYFRNKEFLN
jgi:hypothetical protein